MDGCCIAAGWANVVPCDTCGFAFAGDCDVCEYATPEMADSVVTANTEAIETFIVFTRIRNAIRSHSIRMAKRIA
jgi:hypothetical protein